MGVRSRFGGFTDRLTPTRSGAVSRSSGTGCVPRRGGGSPSAGAADEIAERAVAPSADQVDFLVASRDQLVELRRTVQPLARKLATRLAARRRRAARGQIDIRRTLRAFAVHGRCAAAARLRRRRPARPEIVLLCDVSGSVAGFANFTMLLVQAMHDQFSKVRVYAFVNRVDEVTRLVATARPTRPDSAARIRRRGAVTGWHGSSDYGVALGEFAERYADAVGPRTVGDRPR